MEARVSQSLQLSSWINSDKVVRKSSGSLCFSEKWHEKRRNRIVVSCHLQPRKAARSDKRVELKVSCSSHNVQDTREDGMVNLFRSAKKTREM